MQFILLLSILLIAISPITRAQEGEDLCERLLSERDCVDIDLCCGWVLYEDDWNEVAYYKCLGVACPEEEPCDCSQQVAGDAAVAEAGGGHSSDSSSYLPGRRLLDDDDSSSDEDPAPAVPSDEDPAPVAPATDCDCTGQIADAVEGGTGGTGGSGTSSSSSSSDDDDDDDAYHGVDADADGSTDNARSSSNLNANNMLIDSAINYNIMLSIIIGTIWSLIIC